jgi:hypothetical protein
VRCPPTSRRRVAEGRAAARSAVVSTARDPAALRRHRGSSNASSARATTDRLCRLNLRSTACGSRPRGAIVDWTRRGELPDPVSPCRWERMPSPRGGTVPRPRPASQAWGHDGLSAQSRCTFRGRSGRRDAAHPASGLQTPGESLTLEKSASHDHPQNAVSPGASCSLCSRLHHPLPGRCSAGLDTVACSDTGRAVPRTRRRAAEGERWAVDRPRAKRARGPSASSPSEPPRARRRDPGGDGIKLLPAAPTRHALAAAVRVLRRWPTA